VRITQARRPQSWIRAACQDDAHPHQWPEARRSAATPTEFHPVVCTALASAFHHVVGNHGVSHSGIEGMGFCMLDWIVSQAFASLPYSSNVFVDFCFLDLAALPADLGCSNSQTRKCLEIAAVSSRIPSKILGCMWYSCVSRLTVYLLRLALPYNYSASPASRWLDYPAWIFLQPKRSALLDEAAIRGKSQGACERSANAVITSERIDTFFSLW